MIFKSEALCEMHKRGLAFYSSIKLKTNNTKNEKLGL